MENTILSGDDIRFLATQPESEVTTIVGQMTTLMESITSPQEDTDDIVETMAKQGWFKRMWATVSGKNKATKQEIQKNQDKVVGYISQAVAQLYQMNCINQQVMCSLGNRINEVYMQVTNMYNDQLNMKSQLSEIKAIQQQTLETMGAFVNKLNEKIESVDNFHMLISEIQNGRYKDSSKLYSLCMILAQLDKRTMDDARKVNLLQDTLKKAGIVTDEEISILQCLQDIVALPQEKVGTIYIELCTFRNSFPANLFADMVEEYHFLTKMEKMSKKKEVLIQRVLDKYELDADASFPIYEVANSFIENKQESLISLQDIKMLEGNTQTQTASVDTFNSGVHKYTDEEIREITSKLNEENRLDELFKFVRPIAEQGNDYAQNMLGLCYQYAMGVPQDYNQAAKWYKKSAKQGFFIAQYHLGECYYYGNGVTQDYTKALEWFRKSADQGDDDAQSMIGNCYYYGNGVPQNYKKALEWYRKAAEVDNDEAQNRLGACYYYGDGVSRDYKQAAEWYRKSAEQDHEGSQNMLGICYANGRGVPQDYRQAVEWYRRSAELGHAYAQYNLGNCYLNGEGVPQDYSQAAKWYKQAAEQGHAYAQYNLGNCYYFGDGVLRDYSQAAEWYRKSAEQGNDLAQNNLGESYYYGEGVPQDYSQAVEWFRKSAEQGNAKAQDSLGDCYYFGEGVSQNYKKAVEWYEKSAKQGNQFAQNNLGTCYYNGQGVPRNYALAKKYFRLSANQGNEDAIKKCRQLGC